VYCPSCGKQIPDNSTFCLHCGARIDRPGIHSMTEWEYRDFVYTFPERDRPSRYCVSVVYTRQDVWNEQQKFILPRLQEWLDEGWEPITEIGVAGLEWAPYIKFHINPFDALFGDTSKCERAVAFRVKMRRRKR